MERGDFGLFSYIISFVVTGLGGEQILIRVEIIARIFIGILFGPMRQELTMILQRGAALEALAANSTPITQKDKIT